MKEQDVTKVEFLLTCNENIVVQRYFNVRGYNKKAHKSEEFYDYFHLEKKQEKSVEKEENGSS